eukprot:4107666-Amphidinium_carterae.1
MHEIAVGSGVEDTGCSLDVRVDDSMDRRVPVGAGVLEVSGPRVAAVADGPEVLGSVYKVGPHACHLTDGDTRMTCKKCGRYVTSYKGTWRNLGTIAKQPCKPKARRQKGREGKAPSKQSGGALPGDYQLCHLAPGRRQRPRARPRRLWRFCGTQSRASWPSPAVGGSSGDHELRHCALCRGTFPVERLQGRAIRDQVVQVCCDCFVEHPKTVPRFREALLKHGSEKRRPGEPEGSPGKRCRTF